MVPKGNSFKMHPSHASEHKEVKELNIPQHVSKEILADIFSSRNATHFEAGLVDAQSEFIFTQSLE